MAKVGRPRVKSKIKERKETALEEEKEKQTEVRELEEFYNTGKVENMLTNIEKQKNELVKDMIKYKETHNEPVKYDRDGNPIEYRVNINPLIINNYFFKSITPISSQEPIYNAEKLGMVFDYYCDILTEVNDKIGSFPSSLTSFCKFAGITSQTLRSYKNSDDYNMRVIANKIYDQIGDENLTFSQMGIVKERSTMFKLRSQNELTEKTQPQVKVSLEGKLDSSDKARILENLNKYKRFANKRDN